MKTSLPFLVLFGAAAVLAGCGSSDNPTGSGSTAGAGGDAGESAGGKGGKGGAGTAGKAGSSAGGETSAAGSTEDAGTPGTGGGDTSPGEAGAGGEGGAPDNSVAWYKCQSTDQAFVRRAILGVLGRHAYGQAEVNVYTDIISQVDAMDGYDPNAPISAPITTLRHGRQVALNALLASPDYQANWAELYRDFVRVQRIDEQVNAQCAAARVRTTDAKQVAAWVRDQPPDVGGDGKAAPTFADVIFGSIELDDITPIYTENLFTMVNKTYAGANALPVALELSRRSDFGAWFDGAYLNRDMVCLGCHNSEFSVTQSSDPATNRFYPVPGLFEKALFGDSTGPGLVGDYSGADRLHGSMRRAQFYNDCTTASSTQITAATTAGTLPTCASGDTVQSCASAATLQCKSAAAKLYAVQPWGINSACGAFIAPAALPIDQAYVEARLGNVSGYRTSMWDVATSLRGGFNKLEVEGLGADSDGNIADPDKAFGYLVSMNIVEKVWREIVGTPLTIANYFPRNAASRDQLWSLTETFIKSGYSNKALLSAIFASPYLNMAAPDAGCATSPYDAPRIFDPWRTAEPDPVNQGNGVSDGIQAISARTQAHAAYAALGWPLAPYDSVMPDTRSDATVAAYGQTVATVNGVKTNLIENQFQTETGFYLKSSQPGFRGLDFQGRLGWEDRFAQCKKVGNNTAPDVIDGLVASVKPGTTTIGELVKVLKDRIMGETTITDTTEKSLMQSIVGSSMDADPTTLADLNGTLRQVCGAMITSPQFLMLGVQPKDGTDVPALTPTVNSYQTLCTAVAALPLSDKLSITCTSGQPLTVNVTP